jgi:hypothetical protein
MLWDEMVSCMLSQPDSAVCRDQMGALCFQERQAAFTCACELKTDCFTIDPFRGGDE